jgi:hypothetical protein
MNKLDEFVKSPTTVMPANTGIQNYLNLLDSGFRRNDDKTGNQTFYETVKLKTIKTININEFFKNICGTIQQ